MLKIILKPTDTLIIILCRLKTLLKGWIYKVNKFINRILQGVV